MTRKKILISLTSTASTFIRNASINNNNIYSILLQMSTNTADLLVYGTRR